MSAVLLACAAEVARQVVFGVIAVAFFATFAFFLWLCAR